MARVDGVRGWAILAALVAGLGLAPRPAAASDPAILLRPAQVFTAEDGVVHKG